MRMVLKKNRVVALAGAEEAGQVAIPDIQFQWAEDCTILMAGIAGVSTSERFRKQGIAGRMMAQAVEYARARHYVCGGVSTSCGNVARRLYARAGYEYVFRMDNFHRAPRRSGRNPPRGIAIRGCRKNDVPAIMAIRQRVYRDCFGFRQPDAGRWLAVHKETLAKDPRSVLLAVRDGVIVGYATYFEHWSGPRCELCVPEMPGRRALGTALLRALERRMAARRYEKSKFSLCATESFVRDLLQIEGYVSEPTHVFYVNILDLAALADTLTPVFSRRLAQSQTPDWTGTLEFRMPGSSGVVRLGSDPGLRRIALSAGRPTLTRVLSGALPAWEAYLRGWLDIAPRPDEAAVNALRAILPLIPQCHPADDRW